MGRGGKKKNKNEDKGDLGLGSLSLQETSSTEATPAIQPSVETPTSQGTSSSIVHVETPAALEEVKEGLGTGEGKKKRNRGKKKKETSTTTPKNETGQPGPPVMTPAFSPQVNVPLQPTGPPQPNAPGPQQSMQRGRGAGPPQQQAPGPQQSMGRGRGAEHSQQPQGWGQPMSTGPPQPNAPGPQQSMGHGRGAGPPQQQAPGPQQSMGCGRGAEHSQQPQGWGQPMSTGPPQQPQGWGQPMSTGPPQPPQGWGQPMSTGPPQQPQGWGQPMSTGPPQQQAPGPQQSMGRGRGAEHSQQPRGWGQPMSTGPPQQPQGWGQPMSTGPPQQQAPGPQQSMGRGRGAEHSQQPRGWGQPMSTGPPQQPQGWGQPMSTGPPQQQAPGPQQSMGRGRGAEHSQQPRGWGQPMSTGPPQQPQGWGQPMSTGPPQQQAPGPQQSIGLAGPPQQPQDCSQTVVQQRSSESPVKKQTVPCRFQLPKKIRSRTGVPSRQISVITNYLPMILKPIKVHRYDVSMTPERPKKMVPKVFDLIKRKHFPRNLIAFDQMKNCYSVQPLLKGDDSKFNTEIELEDDNGKVMKFQVSMKYTGLLDFQSLFNYMKDGTALCPPTDTIQCLDVILRQGTLMNYVKASRQYFKRPKNPIDLGDGLEMWTGLFQSAIFTSQPFINIDVAHKGFPKFLPLLDILSEFRLDPRRALEEQRGTDNFFHFLKGLRVTATITDAAGAGAGRVQKREFICNGVVKPANVMQFNLGDDAKKKVITVADYFAKVKGQRLNFPNLNCMWVGPRNKQIYYPMELLHVVYGQALNKQLNERQLSKMVREAATPPSDRKSKIEACIKDMNYRGNEYFKEFGMDISTDFFRVEAKILKPPTLTVGEGTLDPRRGVWQARQFLKAGALQSWGFLAVETDTSRIDCNFIIQTLQRVGKQMGMSVQPAKLINLNVRLHELLSKFKSAWDDGINFLFVIVNSRMPHVYQRVKQLAELDVGILTQCMKDVTAQNKMNEQTVRNILLKVNSKLMGVNQALEPRCLPPCLRDGGVMVVGADVTHPSPDQTDIPSIAAVTASIDPKCYQYNVELSIQAPKREMIVQFESMMEEHLRVYKKTQNCLPRKIYVFRDGVSEGQFAQVMNSELVALYQAYHRLSGGTGKPEVLFMLVQKRHHTRFFSTDKVAQNVEPGTVVDTKIVHNSEMDFYMVSHQAIKGTARPTRYYGVRNDGNITIEEIEQLTYYLCHMYSRCMRSVSYPTPTYYAHLACTRAKNLTQGRERFNNEQLESTPKRLHVLDRMLDCSRMFFV